MDPYATSGVSLSLPHPDPKKSFLRGIAQNLFHPTSAAKRQAVSRRILRRGEAVIGSLELYALLTVGVICFIAGAQ